jgi:hypothetical protein
MHYTLVKLKHKSTVNKLLYFLADSMQNAQSKYRKSINICLPLFI